jgi:hypothetical protein
MLHYAKLTGEDGSPHGTPGGQTKAEKGQIVYSKTPPVGSFS